MQMIQKSWLVIVVVGCITIGLRAQTTNGLITGVVADSTGAVVAGAQVSIVNRDTGVERTAVSDASGLYVVPQLAPGVYTLTVMKEGFASVKQNNIQLLVNQSVTIEVKFAVASINQTIEVNTAPPMLNTTSSTLSEVIGHEETVDLPLNGREFTQLALLTPGAVPQEGGQQSGFTVALGAGGISPSMSGQRADQNNFTMDGVLNNSIYTNVWTISPPPDAIQEFNVQTHITDAQFAISSGANINLVTRSGTNQFHGSVWEFLRNDVLDAQTYPDTKRLAYRQNQYGVYLGGPVIKKNTWFSGYWEGFRFTQANTSVSTTLTPKEIAGDFSAEEGTTPIGIDSLGRPEFANEIYDPTSSRPDPAHPGEFLRDPYPGNVIPSNQLNAASLALAARYFPKPNLSVPEGALNNFVSTVPVTVKSDVFGFRLDHQFTANDTAFLRFNRSQANKIGPQNYNTSTTGTRNYAQVGALNYVHTFNPQTILNFRYAYSYTNNFVNFGQADPGTVAAMGFTAQDPVHAGEVFAPNVSIGNGYSGISNFAIPLGPIQTMDYHLDLSKVMGKHTLGVGGMYYHIRSFDDGWGISAGFTTVGTAQDGGATGGAGTGFAPASFMLGTLDSYGPWVGQTGADQTENWYGWYAQDQWQATRNLVVTAGIRWDFVSPANYHRVESGLNMATGQVCITGAVPPQFPKATCPSGYFHNQYNGWEPRFGLSYRAANHTVVHTAAAILDDHNNTLIQENQNIRLSWPGGALPTLNSLDLGLPTNAYWNALPAASSFLGANNPFGVSYGADPNNKIPYSIEYNLGVEQQLQEHLALNVNYVGSVGRHGYIADQTNTALTPGPGKIQPRALYPQYGVFNYSYNEMPSSYNGLQVELNKQMSGGLSFKASYTWSKSMDWQSDPYGPQPVDFYNLGKDWGPSDYNRPQLFVFSSIYQLPVGKGKRYLGSANTLTDKVLGGWSLGTIISLDSGAPTTAYANGDVANTGWPNQRASRTGADPYSVSGGSGFKQWLNPAVFAQPAPFTLGNESRNDLHGPSFKNVDFNASKTFSLTERTNLIFKAEMFNLFNHTNYGLPSTTVGNGNFGQITTANGTGRLVQFGLKVQF
jgi:hypothetical protein